MSYKIKGEAEVQVGFGLPRHTTASRLAYTPPGSGFGYKVFDTELLREFTYGLGAWVEVAHSDDLDDYVTIVGADTITGTKTFTQPIQLQNNLSYIGAITTTNSTIVIERNTTNITLGDAGVDVTNRLAVTGEFHAESIFALSPTPTATLEFGINDGTPNRPAMFTAERDNLALHAGTVPFGNPSFNVKPTKFVVSDAQIEYAVATVDGDEDLALVTKKYILDKITAASGASTLNDLLDVSVTAPAVGDLLFSDASGDYANRQLVAADISDAGTTLATFAQGATADTALQNITGESIKSLSDVFSTMTPTDGQALVFDTTNGWQAETLAGGVTGLTDLSDVTIATPATGHVLVRDATDFKNRVLVKADVSDFVEGDYATGAEGDLAATALQNLTATSIGTLSDVDITTAAPTAGQALVWNATNSEFEPGTVGGGVASLDDLTDVTVTAPATGHVLIHAPGGFQNRVFLKNDINDFSDVDYATAAQGVTADSALQNITAESIGDLTDVDITTAAPTAGQVLVWSAANSAFEPGGNGDSSDKVLKIGDTMTGALTLDAASDLVMKSASGPTGNIAFQSGAGGDDATIGYDQSSFGMHITSGDGFRVDVSNGTATIASSGASVAVQGSTVTVTGNLTVTGTTTTVNSNNVNIGDAIITLNSDEVGTPSQNGGIEIERGTGINAQFIWNETTDKWQASDNVGSLEDIALASDIPTSVGDLSDVDITTSAPTAGQALVWNATNSEFEPGSPTVDLSNYVDLTTPQSISGTKTFNDGIVFENGTIDWSIDAAATTFRLGPLQTGGFHSSIEIDNDNGGIRLQGATGAGTPCVLSFISTGGTALNYSLSNSAGDVFRFNSGVGGDIGDKFIFSKQVRSVATTDGMAATTLTTKGWVEGKIPNTAGFVDTTTAQLIAGIKSFSDDVNIATTKALIFDATTGANIAYNVSADDNLYINSSTSGSEAFVCLKDGDLYLTDNDADIRMLAGVMAIDTYGGKNMNIAANGGGTIDLTATNIVANVSGVDTSARLSSGGVNAYVAVGQHMTDDYSVKIKTSYSYPIVVESSTAELKINTTNFLLTETALTVPAVIALTTFAGEMSVQAPTNNSNPVTLGYFDANIPVIDGLLSDITGESIGDLTDVDITTVAPTAGQALVWNATNSEFEPGTVSAGATSLDGLSDVTIAAPATGHVLVRDATDFKNRVLVKADVSDFVEGDYATGAEGDLAASALQDLTATSIGTLSDVDITTAVPTAGQALVWNATNSEFEPGIPTVDLSNYVTLDSAQTITGAKVIDGELFASNVVPLEIAQNAQAHTGMALRIKKTSSTSESVIRIEDESGVSSFVGAIGLTQTDGALTLIGGNAKTDSTLAFPVSEVRIGEANGIILKNDYNSWDVQLKIAALTGFTFTSAGANHTVTFDDMRVATNYTNNVSNPAGTLARVDYCHANFMGSATIDNLDDVDTSTVAPTFGQALVWAPGAKWIPGDIPDTADFVDITSTQTITGLKTFDGSGIAGAGIPVHIISNPTAHSGVALKITQSASTSESVIRIEEPAGAGAKAGIIGLRSGELTLIGGVDASSSSGTDFPPTKIDLGVNDITLKHSGTNNAEMTIADWLGFNFTSTNTSAKANFNSMPVQTSYVHTGSDAAGTLVRKDYVEANFAQGTIPTNADYVDLTTAQAIAGDKTFSGNTIMSGNLTVNGTVTTVNSNNVNIADSIITLNSDEAGTPSQNGGIEIERGTATNAQLVWNETTDRWQAGLVGSLVDLATSTDVAATSSVESFLIADWTAGSLTITQATHGVTASDTYHVTAYEGTNVVVVGVSVSAGGDVTLTIDSAAFDGRVRISV